MAADFSGQLSAKRLTCGRGFEVVLSPFAYDINIVDESVHVRRAEL